MYVEYVNIAVYVYGMCVLCLSDVCGVHIYMVIQFQSSNHKAFWIYSL